MKIHLGISILLLVRYSNGASVPSEFKDVQRFLNVEFENPPDNKALNPTPTALNNGGGPEPSGKPDKISVTIMKEYKVPQPGGGYVSIQKQGDDFQGSLRPPPEVEQFIQQATQSDSSSPNIRIQKSEEVVSLGYNNPQNPPQISQTPEQIHPDFKNYKRKTMDGWIPLYGKSYIGPNKKGITSQIKEGLSHYRKGIYYSLAKNEAIRESASSNSHVIVPAVDQTPQILKFTQNEVIRPNSEGNRGGGIETQVKNLVIDHAKSASEGRPSVGQNVVIHAQNVIIKSKEAEGEDALEPSPTPNLSLIKAYESTPQISALLRERFRLNQQQPRFPAGGLPLRTLAQAIRNGAFSLENDVIPSVASEKSSGNQMEIMIPHTFKLRNPPSDYYSTLNPQINLQLAADSINQPVSQYGVPGNNNGGIGRVPFIPRTASTPGLRDFGDSVKYKGGGELGLGGNNQIEIVETGSVTSGSSSLNQLAKELEEKLKQMVQEQFAQAAQQYGVAGGNTGGQLSSNYGVPNTPVDSYGVPGQSPGVPENAYGVPGQEAGAPIDLYGVPGQEAGQPLSDNPSSSQPLYELVEEQEYTIPAHPKKKSKPYSISLDFDTGFLNHQDAHLNIDGGYENGHGGLEGDHEVEHHHDDGGGHEAADQVQLVDAETVGQQTKEALISLGKNLFHGALQFSRKYNPITFYKKVKEFPPIQFEVYDDKHHSKHSHKKH